jgi:hypothetical protein
MAQMRAAPLGQSIEGVGRGARRAGRDRAGPGWLGREGSGFKTSGAALNDAGVDWSRGWRDGPKRIDIVMGARARGAPRTLRTAGQAQAPARAPRRGADKVGRDAQAALERQSRLLCTGAATGGPPTTLNRTCTAR